MDEFCDRVVVGALAAVDPFEDHFEASYPKWVDYVAL